MNVDEPSTESLVKSFTPFGAESCEREVTLLGKSYKNYFFFEAPFNNAASAPDTYLIIGRRGSGKTSLTQFFNFQDIVPDATCIDVDEPQLYDEVFRQISKATTEPSVAAIPRLVQLWEFLIWSLIFDHLKEKNETIKAAVLLTYKAPKPSQFLKELLKHILSLLTRDANGQLVNRVEALLTSKVFMDAKSEAIAYAAKHPIIIAIDTLEKYDVEDEPCILASTALIEAASVFATAYSDRGLHVKAFIAAEIYPFLLEQPVTNPGKHIRDPLFLHWRPKDLIRLICWRFHLFLKANHPKEAATADHVDWNSFQSVKQHLWIPYFGNTITNGNNLEEDTFPYIIRHTQMRPRQLVILCNYVAKQARMAKSFPRLGGESLIHAVKDKESDLATEVINSYSTVYGNVGNILDALSGIDMLFKGKELHRRSHSTAGLWNGRYTPYNFCRLVSELGIVGRVRAVNGAGAFVEADFEYNLTDRLPILESDDLVIHPMFYKKLRVNINRKLRVYPFPDHPDFGCLKGDND